MKALGKIMVAWGIGILTLLYVAFCALGAADAFLKGGWFALAITLVFASAVPSIVIGIVIMERK